MKILVPLVLLLITYLNRKLNKLLIGWEWLDK